MVKIIKELALETEIKRLEEKYSLLERELLIKVLQERINNSKQTIKQDDLMARTFKNSGFGKLTKIIGGGE